MNKRKGFTLTELLAVIVILGILSLIVVPVVTTTLENSRNRAYNFQINNIITGAKSWAAENVMILPEEEGESITITLGQLKMAGHVKKDIKDPRTGELFPDDMEIVITWLMNDYEFRVVEGSGTPGGEYDPNMPTITLIGQTHEYVEINEPYVEKGVIANDPTGAIMEDITVVIKSNAIVVDAVDTTRFGQYTITYSVTYNGKTVSVIRTVTIRDTQLPLLTVPGPIEIEVNEVVTFDLMEGVSASDNSGEPPTITISGHVSIIPGIYTITYTAEDTKGNKTIKTRQITVVENQIIEGFDNEKGVNKPVLATGMTPIKWNGSSWVNTTVNDTDWYDYGTSTKKWANATTADGSMWVWIPRYAYQIATNYHTSTAGTINIKFLQGKTNTASDSTTVAISPTYSGNSQTNYIKHPAFTFGGDELLGFWVAKFEMSGSASAIESKPNVSPLRSINTANMFAYSRNMETYNRYGWGTTGVGIDTHMMKNTEWGAVAYLSQSTYGKNAEVWPNAYTGFVTGCSGSGVNAFNESTCIQYHTTNGQQASTTGNIYGVYDMSGGSWEYVAGVYGSGSDKYYNYYNDYSSTSFGDAVYETSSSVSSPYTNSWYGDYSYMPNSSGPWFVRGGHWNFGSNAGVFSFHYYTGEAYDNISWRVAVLVGDGL